MFVNLIWIAMLFSGICAAALDNNIGIVTTAALQGAQSAVDFAFGLIAIMSFWLGIMKVAEKAGLIKIVSKMVRPFLGLLFPNIPLEHPAMAAIIMNISANILGLGNAATPMGLIAMKEMQKLNRYSSKTATTSMCTFLVLNTSCITLIPATIIGIRVKAGSVNPTEIVGTTIFATGIAMMVGLGLDGIMRRLHNAKGWR